MRLRFPGRTIPVFAICVATLVVGAAAQEVPATGLNDSAPNPSQAQSQPAVALTNRGLADVLRMFEAGISKEVIRAYVESGPAIYELSADDVINLKRRGFPDDLTTALLKKRAAPRPPEPNGTSAAAQPGRERIFAHPVRVPAASAYDAIDPNSYAYFQRYYLHPRAMAAAYQRLGVYGRAHPFGVYSMWGPGGYPHPWSWGNYGR
jgi:hypothetical protein